jgi:hypothetical protein
VAVAAARGWVERGGGVRWRVGGVRVDIQILDGISKKTKKQNTMQKQKKNDSGYLERLNKRTMPYAPGF